MLTGSRCTILAEAEVALAQTGPFRDYPHIMDSPEFIFVLAFPHLYALYALAHHSATLLFLLVYLALLVRRGRHQHSEKPAPRLPVWLNLMHPAWLDLLSIGDIVKSFAIALGVTLTAWPLLATILLVLAMKASGP